MNRHQELPSAIRQGWLEGRYPSQRLTPEASPRRYYRSNHPDTRGWLRVTSHEPAPRANTEFLLSLEVRVPRLSVGNEASYLVEDLGDRHLAHAPDLPTYQQLLTCWKSFAYAELPDGHPNIRLALDEALFLRELALFREGFVFGIHAQTTRQALTQDGLAIDAGVQAAQMRRACEAIANRAASGPQCLQHRDLHSRNVLLPSAGGIALIDHQDMRRGPLYYDLASLLTDAYVDLPDTVREYLLDQVQGWAPQHKLPPAQARHHFRWTALQRILKALGTFANLLNAGREEYQIAQTRAIRHAAELLMALRHEADFAVCEPLFRLWDRAGWLSYSRR